MDRVKRTNKETVTNFVLHSPVISNCYGQTTFLTKWGYYSLQAARYRGLFYCLNSFKSVCIYLNWLSPFPKKSRNRPIAGGTGQAKPSWLCVYHFVFFLNLTYMLLRTFLGFATGSPIVRKAISLNVCLAFWYNSLLSST